MSAQAQPGQSRRPSGLESLRGATVSGIELVGDGQLLLQLSSGGKEYLLVISARGDKLSVRGYERVF